MLGWFKRKSKPKQEPQQTEALEIPEGSEQQEALAEEELQKAPGDVRQPGIPEEDDSGADAQAEEEMSATEPELPEKEEEAPSAADDKASSSMFKRLSDRLSRTRESFTHRLDELFLGKKKSMLIFSTTSRKFS